MAQENVASRLSAREKRAYNRARKALLDLERQAFVNPHLANAMLTLLGQSAGGFIGCSAATNAASLEDVREVTDSLSLLVVETAVRSHAQYLAAERAEAGPPQ